MVVPPREIARLVSIENGEYTIDDSATDEQKKIFDEWLIEIKALEADAE